MARKHEPGLKAYASIDVDRFFTIHEESLRLLESWAIISNELGTIVDIDAGRIIIRGELRCQGDISLFVDMQLVVDKNRKVREKSFSYQAQMAALRIRQTFRYDNAHQYIFKGHPDAFHKHVWNYETWQEIEPSAWIGRYHWPTLAQVVEEVWDWWQVIGQHLAD